MVSLTVNKSLSSCYMINYGGFVIYVNDYQGNDWYMRWKWDLLKLIQGALTVIVVVYVLM